MVMTRMIRLLMPEVVGMGMGMDIRSKDIRLEVVGADSFILEGVVGSLGAGLAGSPVGLSLDGVDRDHRRDEGEGVDDELYTQGSFADIVIHALVCWNHRVSSQG